MRVSILGRSKLTRDDKKSQGVRLTKLSPFQANHLLVKPGMKKIQT